MLKTTFKSCRFMFNLSRSRGQNDVCKHFKTAKSLLAIDEVYVVSRQDICMLWLWISPSFVMFDTSLLNTAPAGAGDTLPSAAARADMRDMFDNIICFTFHVLQWIRRGMEMRYNPAQGPLETSTGTIRKAQKGFRGQGFLTFLVFVINITKIQNWLSTLIFGPLMHNQ